MSIPTNIHDRELQKFLPDKLDRTAVNTLVNNPATNPVPVTLVGAALSTITFSYNEVSSVASGVETTIATYTAGLSGTTKFHCCKYSGENIATFNLKLNGNIIEKQRTYWSNFNGVFDTSNNSGLTINPGDILTITVLHQRPGTANFNATFEIEVL